MTIIAGNGKPLNGKALRNKAIDGHDEMPSKDERVQRLGGRAALIVADQAVSSLTNVALSIVVAREVSVELFGAFSFVYAAYLFALEFSRALILDTLLISYSGKRQELAKVLPRALGASLAVSLVAAVVVGATSAVTSGGLASPLLILACLLPLLLIQDACRAAMVAQRRPLGALVNDLVWAVLLAIVVTILLATHRASVPSVVAAWAGTGALAGLLGLLQVRSAPVIRHAKSWIAENKKRSPYFVLDFLVDSSSFQLAIIVVGGVAGLNALGGFNGARVAMGGVGVVMLASANIIVSEGRKLAETPHRFQRFVEALGAGMAALAVACALGLYFLPASVGESLLGDSFVAARPVLLPMGLYWACRGVMSSARIAMRVTRPGIGAVLLQALSAPLTLIAVAIGAAVGGGAGAAWGLSIVGAPIALVWLLAFRTSLPRVPQERVSFADTGAL